MNHSALPASRSEFSYRTRAYNLSRLRAEIFDILVIGGGITGAGIAREAALRGYKIALVEKNDFASGTSSQSSKLIHGGIRYLETFEFPLVYEASQERRRLLELASNHVWPLPFLYPIYRDNRYGPFLINLGLWLYDGLALFRNVERHRMLSTREISAELPALDVSSIVGGAHYYDAQMNDARLALETIRSAHRSGAVIANHVEVKALVRHTGKRVDGVGAHDVLGNQDITIRARVVVNATGPWTDTILALDLPQHKPRLRPTKGIHLLVPRIKFTVPEGVSFTVKQDRRLMFVLPRGDYTLIGTTDTPYDSSPDRVRAEVEDVNYVLAAVHGSFPGVHLERGDILSTYAGLRPLVGSENARTPGAISREHEIWITPNGLVNIAGGKYTTYRAMAQDLVARVEPILKKNFGISAARPSRTAFTPLIEPDGASMRTLTHNLKNERTQRAYWTHVREVWSGAGAGELHGDIWRGLSKSTRDHLARAYGARHSHVLDYIAADPKLNAPIVEGLPYIWAEVPHALEQEMALTVSDIMIRRLDIFHQTRAGALVAARDIALYMARYLDWFQPDIDREVAAYVQAVEQNRQALKH